MGGIIAVLPLLLYFSVILFFIGLIQWMLILNATVGYIVLGGGCLAALFYFSSTIIAIFFVSAPFKTPLSRFIYAAYHLLFAIFHWVLITVLDNGSPKWIDKRRWVYHTVHKREDRAVESLGDLDYQAMHWMAGQVSISGDSRRRLVLLVAQLLDWPLSPQLESPEFEEAPWISILNFLSQKHKNHLLTKTHTSADGEEFALLVGCAALPAVHTLILPHENYNYEFDINNEIYWSQY